MIKLEIKGHPGDTRHYDKVGENNEEKAIKWAFKMREEYPWMPEITIKELYWNTERLIGKY